MLKRKYHLYFLLKRATCTTWQQPEYTAWIGVALSILIYVAKYTFFDSTKEMAYIPMTKETQAHGKAAVDGLGARLGKSSYGIVMVAVFSLSGNDNMRDNMWYSAVFTLFCSALWIWAMFRLQSAYKQAISTSNSEEPAASQPPSNIETGPLRAPSIPAV